MITRNILSGLRFIIICIAMFAYQHSVKAQYYLGIEAGISYNHLNFNIQQEALEKNVSKNGYIFGLNINYSLNNLFELQSGIILIQKNYSIERTDKYNGIYETQNNTYVQMPFIIQLKLLKKGKLNILLNSGIFLGYWISSNVSGVIPNIFNTTNEVDTNGETIQHFALTQYSERYQFNSLKDNRFEFGFTFGLCANYYLTGKFAISLGANYFQSITDQQKKYMINQQSRINQTICLSVGCIIKLSDHEQ